MALFLPGVAVTAVSSRVGGTVFSHNRGGQYMRAGTIPKKVTSAAAMNQKAVLSTVTRTWAALTELQKMAWKSYTVDNPVVNRIGQKRTLTGHQAYVGLNARLQRSGESLIDVPPTAAPPDPAGLVSFSCDISDTAAEIQYSNTPLPAGVELWVWAAVVPSAGISFIGSRFVLVAISSKAQASTFDIYAFLLARFGTLQANQVVWIKVQTMDTATGLVSGIETSSAVITA